MVPNRVIGVDLGGTKILTGVVDRDGTIRSSVERETPTASQEALLAAVTEAIAEQLEDGVGAIGLGIPSPLDLATGRALGAVNIPLRDVDVRGRVGARFGLPVGIENDGNAAALAEWRFGAGRGASDLIMLTLGTGIGGGAVSGGRHVRAWAEFGHIVVDAGGPRCQGACNGHGHLEAVASGLAADRAARELLGADATARDLVRAAETGDAAAVDALARIGRFLGIGIGSLVNAFGAQLVVIGGGFGTGAGQFLLGPALAAARAEALTPADEGLRLVEAELGAEAGLVGAALVGFEALDGER